MKALDSTFNQEKALVGAFSVIVKTDGSFAALLPDDMFRTRSVELLGTESEPRLTRAITYQDILATLGWLGTGAHAHNGRRHVMILSIICPA